MSNFSSKNTSFKKITSYLQNDHQSLQFIYSKTQQLIKLNQQFLNHLDASISPYCQVANKTGNKLILLVANGSVATQLRLQMHDLIKKIQRDQLFKEVKEIQCKVNPSLSVMQNDTHQHRKTKMQPLSAQTADVVRAIAETIKDDRLRAILKKIAG